MDSSRISTGIDVSRQTINSIELGKYIPSTVLALRLANYFSVNQVYSVALNQNKAICCAGNNCSIDQISSRFRLLLYILKAQKPALHIGLCCVSCYYRS
ncbi:MAG: helix-turn-helix transcriptional regulator [Candidatus Cyclobacteriaceae bacterium M3_2C_046]